MGRWPPGYGCVGVALGLLWTAALITSDVVFPNDVLSSLDKYNTDLYSSSSSGGQDKASSNPRPLLPSSSNALSPMASPSRWGESGPPAESSWSRERHPSSSSSLSSPALPSSSLSSSAASSASSHSVSNDVEFLDTFFQKDPEKALLSSSSSSRSLIPPLSSAEENSVDGASDSDRPDLPSQRLSSSTLPANDAEETASTSASSPSSHQKQNPTAASLKYPESNAHPYNPLEKDLPPGLSEDHPNPKQETKAAEKAPPNPSASSPSSSSSPSTHTTHESKQCPLCQRRDEDRVHRIESLKRRILDQLHFTSLPNRPHLPVPKALSQISGIQMDLLQDSPYESGDDEASDDEYTPPERVFTTGKPLPVHLNSGSNNSCYFAMPAEVYGSKVTKAYLWFYVRHPRASRSKIVQMQINRLGPPFFKKQRSSKRVVWTHKAYPEKASGWKRVDVTNIVRRWVRYPSSNYGLEVLALSGGENLAILPPTPPDYEGYELTLDIKVSKDDKRRYRRSDSLTCSKNSTEYRCCRYPMSVSFAEFGWEWVIAPKHVNVDFCSGECKMTLQNKTPYSWITSQTSKGSSCCVPSKMKALPLLYFDQQGDVVFQMLQNMQVERCGCA